MSDGQNDTPSEPERVRKPRWPKKPSKHAARHAARAAGAPAPGQGAGALRKAERRVRSGEAAGEPGVPRAVERAPAASAKPHINPLASPSDARAAWLLDVLAYARHGRLAERVDLRASRATMPPVVLADGDGPIVALDDAAAIGRLASRSRAFSQIAARYAALGLVAREQGRPLVLELWDLGTLIADEAPTPRLAETAEALARYLEAEVVVADLDALRTGLRVASAAALPAALVTRNPLAWLGPAIVAAIAATEPAEA